MIYKDLVHIQETVLKLKAPAIWKDCNGSLPVKLKPRIAISQTSDKYLKITSKIIRITFNLYQDTTSLIYRLNS